MEDIISQGEDRPPGGWRRRLGWIAVAAVVVALIGVEHLPRGRSARPHPHPSVRSGGVQYGGGRALIRLRTEGPAPLPSGIIGQTRRWAATARLPRTGAQPDWFWPARGRVAPILGLPIDRFGYAFTRVIGGWAMQPDPRGPPDPPGLPGPVGCGGCADHPVPVFYLPDRAKRAVMVGRASLVAPAAVGGRMWLTSYPPEADLATTAATAREYSGTGDRIGQPIRLPAGYGIAQGTRRGLLLVPMGPGGPRNTYWLWNPATGEVARAFAGVIAVGANAVAYTATNCGFWCPVHVLNLVTGRVVTLRLPGGESVTAAVFSPDGRYVGLQVSFGDGGGGALAMRLAVAATATGRLTVVPHTWVSSDALVGFGWPGAGDDLVAEFSFSARVQMTFWDPVAGQLAVAAIKKTQDPTALVVG